MSEEWGRGRQSILDEISSDKRVLDVGCNKGEFSHRLLEKGIDVIAIDKECNVIYSDVEKRFILLDVCRESLPIGFDVILALFVMEHLENVYEFARNAYSSLNKGGVLYVVIPNGLALWSRVRYLFERDNAASLGSDTHNFFTYRTAHKPLIDAGFKTVEEDNYFSGYRLIRCYK